MPIPDVVGLTFTEATVQLENDGFTVVGKHTRVGQVVTRTNPSGEAPAGSMDHRRVRPGGVALIPPARAQSNAAWDAGRARCAVFVAGADSRPGGTRVACPLWNT